MTAALFDLNSRCPDNGQDALNSTQSLSAAIANPHPMKFFLTLILTSLITAVPATAAESEVVVPACTAYFEPVAGARIVRSQEQSEIVRWHEAATDILWYGQIREPGMLQARVQLASASAAGQKFRLQVGEQSRSAVANKTEEGSVRAEIDFGAFVLNQSGYVCFRLQRIADPPSPDRQARDSSEPSDVDLHSLRLTGPAVKNAHFNLKPRRNAASVHLFYPVPKDQQVAAFYCQMTALEDPVWSYYMACGWHRGYFGMQVNSPTERRIIFSVWDSGNEAIDRKKVAAENRVRLVGKGNGVYAGDFGNEGTGGHSHLKYQWKTGQPQHFVVTAQPVDESHTVYSGYYLHPEKNEWMLISSWNAPFEGGYLRGLYSFSENFVGRNGHLHRKALYGNQWIRTEAGDWQELTTAKFSHDGTGRQDRLDRFMGLQDGHFFLAHGGFRDGFTDYGKSFQRPPTGRLPAVLKLPGLPFQ